MEWIIAILVAIIVYVVITRYIQKRNLKTLTEEEFRAGYRKAQLIDVREPNEFDNGHILGARNIPVSQLKMRIKEIRKDQPVYMYDYNGIIVARAASILRKHGIKDLYQLKGGFKKWGGKVKKK